MSVWNDVGSFLGFGSGVDNGFKDIDRANFNMPDYQDRQNRDLALANQLGNRTSPQARYYTAADSGFRGDQTALVGMLRQQALGQGPSLAEQQLRQATDRNIAQQQALMASARPNQAALAARLASQNAGRINQGFAGQAEQARIAEQLGAMNQWGGVIQGARGQDIGLNQFNAQQMQQGGQFNSNAALQNRQINDQALLELLRQEYQNAQAQQQGGMGYEQQRTAKYGVAAGVPTLGQALLGGASTVGAAYATGGKK